MFNFNRRINGATYYIGLVISILVALGADLLTTVPTSGIIAKLTAIIILFILIALVTYWICLTKQRANDIGWHPLLVTLVSFWTPIFLLLGLLPGQPGPNQFGAKPTRGIKLV